MTQATAERILTSAGIPGAVTVSPVRTLNHVWRREARRKAFFLKIHTKDWYAGNPDAWGRCVTHEDAAYQILAAHGLAAPDVVRAERGSGNPFGRPLLVTAGLPGAPLTEWLAGTGAAEAGGRLAAVGEYLGRMHANPGSVVQPPRSACSVRSPAAPSTGDATGTRVPRD